MPSTALYTAACANANHMIPSALFSPAPFGGAPAMVLTEIAFQSVMTAGSAAAGGWTAEAGNAAVNAALMPRAARMATKPVRLPTRTFITPPSPPGGTQLPPIAGPPTDHPPARARGQLR